MLIGCVIVVDVWGSFEVVFIAGIFHESKTKLRLVTELLTQ